MILIEQLLLKYFKKIYVLSKKIINDKENK